MVVSRSSRQSCITSDWPPSNLYGSSVRREAAAVTVVPLSSSKSAANPQNTAPAVIDLPTTTLMEARSC